MCEPSELEQSEREGGSWSCRASWAKEGLWVEEGQGTRPDSGAHRRPPAATGRMDCRGSAEACGPLRTIQVWDAGHLEQFSGEK